MRPKIALLALCMWGFLPTQNTFANDALVFNTVHYPPYEIQSPEDNRDGFDIEVIREIFKRLKRPIAIKFVPWKRALKNALNGTATGVFSCSARDNFYLTDPISTATDALFFNKDFDFDKYPISKAKDLKAYPNLKVGGVAGYKLLDHLDNNEINYDSSPDDETAFRKLFSGQIDVFITTKEFANFTLSQIGLSHLVTYKPLKHKNYYLCLSKSWKGIDKLRVQFNQTLNEIRKDGTYDAIHARYR